MQSNPASNHTAANPWAGNSHAAPSTQPGIQPLPMRVVAVDGSFSLDDLETQLAAHWQNEPGEISLARPIRRMQAPRLDTPVAVIGVGGTARSILTKHKKQAGARWGCVPDNLGLLAIDSGDEVIEERDSQGRVVQLETGSELLALTDVPLGDLKLNRQHFVELVERLGSILDDCPQTVLKGGARQQRILGLIIYYFHFATIREAVRRLLLRITERRTEVEAHEERPATLTIVLVFSGSGGEGSSKVVDMAALLRHEVAQLGDRLLSTRFIGLMVLADAFSEFDGTPAGQLLQPNLWAVVEEIEAHANGLAYRQTLPGVGSLSMDGAPFDQLFVLGRVNQRGEQWRQPDDLYTMAARALDLLFCDDLGAAQQAYGVNAWAQGPLVKEGGVQLSSAGLAEILFPGPNMAVRATLRQSLAMLDLATAADAAQLPDAPSWTPAEWASRLLPSGSAEGLQLPLPAEIEQAALKQMPGLARAYVDNFRRVRLYTATYTALAERAQNLAEEERRRLDHWIEQLGRTGRVEAAAARLAQAAQGAQTLVETQRAATETAARTREELQQSYAGELRALDDLTLSGGDALGLLDPLFDRLTDRRGRCVASLRRVLQAAEALLRQDLLHQTQVEVSRIVQELAQTTALWRDQAAAAAQRLRQGRALLAGVEQRLAQPVTHSMALVLDDAELVDFLHARHAHDPADDLQTLTADGADALLRCGALLPAALARRIVRAAAPAFLPIATLPVETVMQWAYPELSPGQWLHYLQRLMADSWVLDLAKVPPSSPRLARFTTLGVPNAADSLFAGQGLERFDLHSTGDPQRIVALRTSFGPTFADLRQARGWQESHARAKETVRLPLHVFPHFWQGSQTVQRWFVLGRVFGWVARKGRGHYFDYQPADPLLTAVPLGNGLAQALATLAARRDLLAELEQRCAQQIAQIGRSAAQQQIRAFVAAQPKPTHDLARHLLQTARAYADGLD